MRTFSDMVGDRWTLALTLPAIRRIKAALDVDLLEVIEGKHLDRLTRDIGFLCDVIYLLCKPEADARNLSAEQFGERIAGDVIDAAAAALAGAITDFFPKAQRPVVERLSAIANQAMERAADAALERLDPERVETAMRQAIEQVLAGSPAPAPRTSGDSSTTASACSDLKPAS
ncbi:MAG: hypothetical protein HRF50_04505 [Phycisphaerae bacterium]|jgi:hypothetical protein